MSSLDVHAQMRGHAALRLRNFAWHIGWSGLRSWSAVMRRRRTRWQLAVLDRQRLDDIGMSQADALREVRRSFPFRGRSMPDRLGDWP